MELKFFLPGFPGGSIKKKKKKVIHIISKDDKSVKTSGRCITQLTQMTIDPKCVELTAHVCVTITSSPFGGEI